MPCQLHPVCNDTKWEEFRQAMLAITATERPVWQSVALNGFVYGFDGDWYYHFRLGDHKHIRHVDVASASDEIDHLVLESIRRIGLAASRVESHVWRIYGYVEDTNLATIP